MFDFSKNMMLISNLISWENTILSIKFYYCQKTKGEFKLLTGSVDL